MEAFREDYNPSSVGLLNNYRVTASVTGTRDSNRTDCESWKCLCNVQLVRGGEQFNVIRSHEGKMSFLW